MSADGVVRTGRERLWTLEFAAVNAICLLAFGTLSLFYGFYDFLAERGVDPAWRGPIISLFSFTALLLRPTISARLKPGSIMPSLFWGQVVCIAAMWGYSVLEGGPGLAVARMVHGAGYVVALSAAVALLARILPPSRSGEGFSVNTIMALLPNAIVPMVVERWPGAAASGSLFAWGAVCMLPGLAVLPLLRKAAARDFVRQGAAVREGVLARLMAGLRQPGARALLAAFGLAFLAVVMVFFYVKTVCAHRGAGDPGVFLGISTWVVIATRLGLGPFFDRFDRKLLCLAGLCAMGAGLALPALSPHPAALYAAAVVYGLGVGVATPLLNALIFLVSRPDLRGLNANLMLQMLDLAYVVGPVAGGLLLWPSGAGGFLAPHGAVFAGAAAACIAAVLVVGCGVRNSEENKEAATP